MKSQAGSESDVNKILLVSLINNTLRGLTERCANVDWREKGVVVALIAAQVLSVLSDVKLSL